MINTLPSPTWGYSISQVSTVFLAVRCNVSACVSFYYKDGREISQSRCCVSLKICIEFTVNLLYLLYIFYFLYIFWHFLNMALHLTIHHLLFMYVITIADQFTYIYFGFLFFLHHCLTCLFIMAHTVKYTWHCVDTFGFAPVSTYI